MKHLFTRTKRFSLAFQLGFIVLLSFAFDFGVSRIIYSRMLLVYNALMLPFKWPDKSPRMALIAIVLPIILAFLAMIAVEYVNR
jgi:hypothetical protein